MGRGLLAGMPLLPWDTVRGMAVAVTGWGGINNTVQDWGSRRGSVGQPPQKGWAATQATETPRDVGPRDTDMGTHGARRTQKGVMGGWRHRGGHTQRNGDWWAGLWRVISGAGLTAPGTPGQWAGCLVMIAK